MTPWRPLLILELVSIQMLLAQVVVLPAFVLAAFTSGRQGAVLALEMILVLPVAAFLSIRHVKRFKSVPPEQTEGMPRVICYFAHIAAFAAIWQFLYIKYLMFRGPGVGQDWFIFGPMGDLFLSFVVLSSTYLVIWSYSTPNYVRDLSSNS